jgi:DNA-binding SARP family transcriptional activator
LGALRVEDQQKAIHVPTGKAQSLFTLLVLYPASPHPREVLADRLWPEAPPSRVRRNLSDVLYRLRRTLGPDWLTVEGDRVALRTGPDLWVDVWEFEQLFSANDLASLQRAAALYSGDLLPEIYDDWILSRRVSLHERYLTCLLRLGQIAEGHDQPQLAHEHFQRLVQVDPLREEAYHGVMRSLASMGRLMDALAAFTELEQLLEVELGVQPSQETRTLADGLRGEIELSRQAADYQQDRHARPPFVGRVRERTMALEAVEATIAGRGGIFAIEGEAGIGKTRLLEEIGTGAHWRGATVAVGSATEYPTASPFRPLADALSAALGGPRATQMETLLPAETLAACAPLYPPWRQLAPLPKLPPEQARRRFHQAVVALCQTLTTLSPHLLILDDLHWADLALWETLDALVPILDQNRLLVLLAYRRPEIEQNLGWQILQRWDREGRLQLLSLGPLDERAVSEILPSDMRTEAPRVLADTGGNPFLITEMLAALAEGRTPSRSTAVTRAEALPDPVRRALEVAAVVGSQVPYRLWAMVANLPPHGLAEASEQLAAQRLLQPTSAGYAFAHDLIHAAIYENLEPERRQSLHRKVADALGTSDPDNLRVRAFHLDRAGAHAEAAATYRQVGAQDQARFAFAEARTAFERALSLMPATTGRERIETLLALVRVCDVTGDRARQREALDLARHAAHALEEATLVIQTLTQTGDFAAKTGDLEEAETYLIEALALARGMDDQAPEIDILLFLGDLLIRRGQLFAARTHFEETLELAQQLGMRQQEARALDGLGYMMVQLGEAEPQTMINHFEQALAIQRAIGDRLGESRTLSNLLTAFQNLGAWDRILTMADQVLAAQKAVGYRLGEAVARQAQGLAACALGNFKDARDYVTAAREGFADVGDRLGVGIATNALGLIAEREGEPAAAADCYEQALAIAEEIGSATFAAYARQDLGGLWVNGNQEADAVPHLETAMVSWREAGDKLNELKCKAYLALAFLALGKRSRAEELADKGWAAFQCGVSGGEEPQVWLWTLYRVFDALERFEEACKVLQAAYQELGRQGRAIGDHEMRRRFFNRVPLNRAIVAAYDNLTHSFRHVTTTLARKKAPLGRTLNAAEKVEVRWTIHAPEDEAITGKAARRRYALQRLLAEAEAHDAAPTDEDLAKALGVSRRTILRDMEALAEAGLTVTTRRRK